MNNIHKKDVAKAETAFTSNERMHYKYMLREGIDISLIAKITSRSTAKIQQIANKQSQS